MNFGEQTWRDNRANSDKVVVVPLGSLEQHGHHLPMLTDTYIGGEIARRAEADLRSEALFLPMLWLGSSHHHLHYGAISVNSSLYTEVVKDMLECLISQGFRRMFLLNAHGGNIVPGTEAITQLTIKHRHAMPDLWLTFSSWWDIAAPQIAAIEALQQKGVTHACELETSAILKIHPELTHMDKARGAHFPFDSKFYTPDYSGPSRVSVARTFEQYTQTGALGHPEISTPEKGEAILQAATREVIAFVREFAKWPAALQPN